MYNIVIVDAMLLGLQKIDGIYGSIVVRQPPSQDPNSHLYDYDLTTHVILLSDWLHEDAMERFPGRLAANTGQDPESVLINGKGQFTVSANGHKILKALYDNIIDMASPGPHLGFRRPGCIIKFYFLFLHISSKCMIRGNFKLPKFIITKYIIMNSYLYIELFINNLFTIFLYR